MQISDNDLFYTKNSFILLTKQKMAIVLFNIVF